MFKNLSTRRSDRRSQALARSLAQVIDTLESRQLFSTAVGLIAGNALVTFDTATPTAVSAPVAVTGLATSETLVGIDYRPSSGVLFGLGSTGQLYTLNLSTGAATAVGNNALTLTGANFDIDFNPQVDRLRVVSNTGQNIRVNPDTGAQAASDTALAYDAGDANAAATPSVAAAAYANNFAGTTGTTLYVIDSGTDTLDTQGSVGGSPTSPNTGTLFTVGSLGIDVSAVAGFDISSADGVAYAVLNAAGAATSQLYSINLTTGAATALGTVGSTANGATPLNLTDISVAPTSFYALASSGTTIAKFSTSNLSTPTNLTVTGLATGDTLTAIDFRPATGDLFALGTSGQIYTIALSGTNAGAATAVGSGLGTTSIPTVADIDFNPVVDRLRVVGSAGQNARVDPTTGAYVDTDTTTAGTQLDTTLSYTGNTPTPDVVAVAYTDPVAGATSTTLYGIDASTDQLVTIGSVAGVTPAVSPNTGALTNVGALGVDVTSGGLDVAPSGTTYALLNVQGTAATGLYSINLTTGAATLIGALGDGSATYSDLAVADSVISLSAATSTVGESVGNATLTLTRNGDTTAPATVNFTAAGTGANAATAGSDFGTSGVSTFTGAVTFAAGETSKTVQIPILADTVDETNETFTVTLASPTTGSLGATSAQVVTITDDDGPSLSISDASVAEGGVLTFTVTLSQASAQTVTVSAASDTTGTAGTNDFTALAPTTLTFAPGETSKTITIQTTQDTDVEPDETVNVVLSNATNADIADANGVGTITNDDLATGVTAAADPVRTGTKNQVLTITGTNGNDVITVTPGKGGTVVVTLNGANQAIPSTISKKNLYRIVILGGAGDDDIRLNSKVNYSAEIYGEAGNDILVGGKNRDLLVGGDGIDSLYGGQGDDILVAGSLNFGSTPLTSTATLLNAFLGKGNFAQRAGLVTGSGTGGFAFSNTTVVDDGDRDYLFGQGSSDLIIRSNTNQDAVADETNKGSVTTLGATPD